MAPDKFERGRRPKVFHDLLRRKPSRKIRDRVLIVCEGSKTEPNYLKQIRSELGLTNAEIRICGEECASDPKLLVKYAMSLFKSDKSFDRVYCVFDKDHHSTYQSAVDLVRNARVPRNKNIATIKSVPCFEFWVLLHYKLSTSPFVSRIGRSAAEQVIEELGKFLSGYSKGHPNLYELIKEKTDTAIRHAKIANKLARESGTDNPTTEMVDLLEYLQGLRER